MKKSVPTFVPDVLKSLAFMEKDSKRFPNTHGWAYAKFEYDAASKMFKPSVTGLECGYACHTKVATKDYIFTPTRLQLARRPTVAPLDNPREIVITEEDTWRSSTTWTH